MAFKEKLSLPEFAPRLLEVALGGLFLYAGAMKMLDPSAFASEIANYRLVPWNVAAAGALFLPWLEITCGIALIAGRCRLGALLIFDALLLVFIGALAYAGMRGLDISCGCFGSSIENSAGQRVIGPLIARDCLILAVSLRLSWLSAIGSPGGVVPQ